MAKEFVETLSIGIVETQKTFDERIDIYFGVEKQKYWLVTKKDEEGLFRPSYIVHLFPISCPFCQNDHEKCFALEAYIVPLFHRLINMAAIRLEWLYIPHEEV